MLKDGIRFLMLAAHSFLTTLMSGESPETQRRRLRSRRPSAAVPQLIVGRDDGRPFVGRMAWLNQI
jgi:hypothetical protein